jgi:hypothetical protein
MINIVFLSIVLEVLYFLFSVIYKKGRLFNSWFFVFSLVLFLPKINLIDASSKYTTAGIRIDDLIILFSVIYLFFSHLLPFKNSIIKKATFLLLVFAFSSVISFLFGLLTGLNNSILYSIFEIIRPLEYFCAVLLGFSFAKKKNYIKQFDFNFNCLFLMFALVGFLQCFGLCGYAVSGEYSSSFFHGISISTFNGYYEYAAYLCFATTYYLIKIFSNRKKLFSAIFLLLSLILLLLSQSRTGIVVTAIISLCVVIYFIRLSKNKLKNLAVFIFCFVGILIFSFVARNASNSRFSSSTSLTSILETLQYYSKNTNFYTYIQQFETNSGISYGLITDLSMSVRFYKWFSILHGFLAFPFFGYGPAVTHVVDGNYIRLLGENGLVGTFAFLYFLFYICKFGFKNKKNNLSLFLSFSIISLLFDSIFIDMFLASKIMYFIYFLFGIVAKSSETANVSIKAISASKRKRFQLQSNL